MLGAPEGLDTLGVAALGIGLVAAAAAGAALVRRHGVRSPEHVAAVVALLVAVATAPLLVWRVGHDLAETTSLPQSDRRGAGPIQAFLQPYLLDDAAAVLPPDATYAAVAGPAVPYETARRAFPSLALTVFFPRISVADPAAAEWVVAWGTDPRDVAPVEDVRVVTPAAGVYPPVVVARVRRG